MPEILQRAATPERLAQALLAAIGPSAERERQLAGFARVNEAMGIGRTPPATAAADVVLSVLRRDPPVLNVNAPR
jgi:lipid-A-disaccharide synthase